MLKEIKYLIFIFLIFLFLFFTTKFYFSETNKKNSYRSINNIEEKIKIFAEKLPVLEDNTQNVVEYIGQSNKKKKKKFNFWKLLEDNE
tara:strand:+ start:522 stop:785 length:264 start_codon:yes stop_codon:yes gene_type:complete